MIFLFDFESLKIESRFPFFFFFFFYSHPGGGGGYSRNMVNGGARL